MSEYAILSGGEIINVVATTGSLEEVQKDTERRLVGGPYEVRLLDELPLAVKERYEFWAERP